MKKTSIFILLLTILLNISAVYAADGGAMGFDDVLEQQLNAVCNQLLKDVPSPEVASAGGEWTIIALARARHYIPYGYYDGYYEKAVEYLRSASARRYTDYSRILLALTAIGAPTEGAEEFLEDYNAVIRQGINGAIFALIALDGGGYESTQRERYLELILNSQHVDGGFGLDEYSDTDVTAMAMQAIAAYSERDNVRETIDRARTYIDNAEITTCESAAQCLIAYCALAASDYGGEVPEGYYNELMTYRTENMFSHVTNGEADLMATEQAALALTAFYRHINGMSPLYTMIDAEPLILTGEGIFADVAESDREITKRLSEAGIFNGKTDRYFDPDGYITRAELAAVTVRALYSMNPQDSVSGHYFDDVAPDAWYSWYVNAAAGFGIVNGIDGHIFAPDANVTHMQAGLIMSRLAEIIGTNVNITGEENSDVARIEAARMIAEILWKE